MAFTLLSTLKRNKPNGVRLNPLLITLTHPHDLLSAFLASSFKSTSPRREGDLKFFNFI
jgi:hypothetical protein